MILHDTDVADLPLAEGARGEAVRDLQRRLAGTGHEVEPGSLGVYGSSTTGSVARFQQERGLLTTGTCDDVTWSALVEAGYQPGDRLLYHRRPMLRGDDVIGLQLCLSSLGFDAGRVDGIFGPDTELALKDFQRNAGLTTDGVCGRDVLAAIARLGARNGYATNVARVRERERLQATPRVLAGRRVALGDLGGLDVVTAGASRRLQGAGALVSLHRHPDPSVQASECNRFEADAYVGLGIGNNDACQVCFYATTGFESLGGRRLAELMAEQLAEVTSLAPSATLGLRIPVLRETRMPAIICLLGPAGEVVTHSTEIADATSRAVERWVAEPLEPGPDTSTEP